MNDFLLLIVCSLAGGLFSLVGGALLISHKNHRALSRHATSFAAGALLAAAFVDLLPDAIDDSPTPGLVPLATLAGVLLFFLLESSFQRFHHHRHQTEKAPSPQEEPAGLLLIFSDMFHGVFDGIAIAAGFLVNPMSGIIVTLAVCAHEIPQEIGEFAFLANKQMPHRKIILLNILASLSTTAAAVLFYLVGTEIDINSFLPFALATVAGFFIYIAVSDIIPGIHESGKRKFVLTQSALLLAGVAVVSALFWVLHGFIG